MSALAVRGTSERRAIALAAVRTATTLDLHVGVKVKSPWWARPPLLPR
ncbi:hypothetical protein MOV08_07350 [Streptomyces yunnanensis]|uniref:Uncharacterized protein n=1 Tax=Streptomyces yunnanensis TaxID=156453 RepID=A0ABY8A2F6_9ACTN|nr:hypothetical protein [Streptomyces yunnanensis]WEB39125.1 hypothetical protein MOV08_07350 [Streptomyces yunnanensis]